MTAGSGNEPGEPDFAPDARGWAQRWTMEFAAARKELEKWHGQGAKIIKRFRDERDARADGDTRWNLFSANVQTQRAIMYGQTPRVTVSRRYADAHDDVARVAAEMLERLLNSDIERGADGYAQALANALDDRLLVGAGCVRLRYVAEFETVLVEAVLSEPDVATGEVLELAPAYEETRKTSEDVEADYVHWRDALWSPARVWSEVRWYAYRAQMSREQLVERFGEDIGRRVPLNAKRGDWHRDEADARVSDPWGRADVWEVWSKEHRRVFWYVEGYESVLDSKADPLGLEGFFPMPRPLFANLTSDALVPRPDFVLAQDLYDEIDAVSTRITLLERAIKVAGVYDRSADGVKRLLSDTAQNELIPIENWAAFSEKGGIRGMVDWLPLEQIVSALTSLRDYRRELLDALYQVTGMSDIMRGQAASGGVTATEQAIKARFGSVRMQSFQDEFARFASDAQRIKAEIIAKHFDAQTVLERSNIQHTADARFAAPAVDLLKSRARMYRVEVKPEAVSLTDFAALKAERSEVLSSVAGFLQSVAPLAAQMPGSLPFLLQILQWSLSGLRGASTIEGVVDQAIATAQAAAQARQAQPQAQPPDPKLLAVRLKGEQDMAKEQFKLQADLARLQAETAAHAQQESIQREENVREAAQKAVVSRALKSADNIVRGPRGTGGLP